MIYISEKEKDIVINALRAASEQYKQDAADCKDIKRTHDQFLKQAQEADELVEKLED